MENVLLSIPDACEAMSIKRSSLYRLIGDKKLSIVKIGRRTLIPAKSISEFVESSSSETDK